MQISANMVKQLRERTGAGMMECKKALIETAGDLDTAAEFLRKTGAAKADKKAGRIAAEGVVVISITSDHKRAVILEINSETDFVAKDQNFQDFAEQVAAVALAEGAKDLDALLTCRYSADLDVDAARQALVAKLGENIQVRRFETRTSNAGFLAYYIHGGKIGVLLEMTGGSESLAKDIAMHIAASKPMCLSESQVPQSVLDKEREIQLAQAQDSGKPRDIVEKMVQGRIKKYLAEVTLLGQAFVKDPEQTISKLLASAGAEILFYCRYEVGEGLEKKTENFADQVMAQVKNSV